MYLFCFFFFTDFRFKVLSVYFIQQVAGTYNSHFITMYAFL